MRATRCWLSQPISGSISPGANRQLAPLLYARTSGGRPLTRSGVYYLPFSEPGGPQGEPPDQAGAGPEGPERPGERPGEQPGNTISDGER